MAPRARGHRFLDPARGGDVVVLDEDAVIEAEAMVEAAADAHGVFLDGAQIGHASAGPR